MPATLRALAFFPHVCLFAVESLKAASAFERVALEPWPQRKSGIHVAEYLTELPPREILRERTTARSSPDRTCACGAGRSTAPARRRSRPVS